MAKDKCIVITGKKAMLIYEILYIVGLTFVLIGGLLNYYLNEPKYLWGSIIDATALFLIATIIWAFDRKCEPIKELMS